MRSVRIVLVIALVIATSAGEWYTASAQKDSDQAQCVAPAKGPIFATPAKETGVSSPTNEPLTARVGKPAPDFEANALVRGEFKNVKLSDYAGRWVVMCFYPGDFTFV